jgi:hypothetical protein
MKHRDSLSSGLVQLFFREELRQLTRNLDVFRSDIGKWVLPRIRISGRCTTVTSPPWRFTTSRHLLAISKKMRHCSWPGFALGLSGMLSPK